MKQGEMFMVTYKKRSVLLIVLLASLLTGCYQNPMTHTKPRKAAIVLLHASRAAEKELGIEPSTGWAFNACMEEKAPSNRVDCDALYKAMLPFAQQDSAFKHLTVAQLSDKATFEPIAEEYFFRFFNNID